ncbi:MAG: ABC transporter permease [Deinococcus sp.]|nr:ABC transporter permease [Deinococcus sp.]
MFGTTFSRLLFVVSNTVLLGLLALAPWTVPKRDFDGAALLVTPFGMVSPRALQVPGPEHFLGSVTLGFWVFALLVVLAVVSFFHPNPRRRAQMLYILGGIGLAVFALEAVLFYQAVYSVNSAALAAGTEANRLPLKRYALSLGAYLGLFYSLALLLAARLQLPAGLAFLVRYRGVVVPLFSLLLASLFGMLVVALLTPAPGAKGLTLPLANAITAKLDLVTYTFQLLFSPLVSLPGWFQSLLLATPLIFTGLGVAFGFRAGLFNIGAPGQLTLGAISCMLVGVYMPGPGWLVLPLSIVAAALGGALWGAIPGWLKARFGAHEVINTIMMNYIASSVFLFIISSNEYKFFGATLRLPFKAEGFEARSAEIPEGARLPFLLSTLAPQGHLSWAVPLAVVLALGVYAFFRRLDLGRRLLLAAAACLAGFVAGGFLPGPPVEISPALRSVRLNDSFFIAVVALFFYNFYLFRTAGGYELRALGFAPKAAEYAGVNIGRKTILAMAISGALVGLAATHYVAGGGIDEYRLKQSLPVSVGFDGIAVALMGQNTPTGVALSALLFGVLLTGGLQLNLQLGISRELVTVLQALIVLFIAAGGFLPRYFTDPLKAAEVETEAKASREASHTGKEAC